MLTVGLTGQSGAGKGLLGSIISKHENVKVIDTDITARLVVEKGQPCLKELCECFGEKILRSDGKINIRSMYDIMEKIVEWKNTCEKEGVSVAVIDAPLLFESGADKLCDVTVGVIAPYEIRLERIMKRDGIEEKDAKLRLDSQPKDDFFTKKCSYIIKNSGSTEEFELNANELINKLLNEQNNLKGSF